MATISLQLHNDLRNYRRAQYALRRFWRPAQKGDYFTDRHDPIQYLRRTRWLLHELGDADHNLRFIHVTGTAGKGTVSAMIANGLIASGKKTGWFHSPEVVTTTEQIQVNGRFISMKAFTRILNRITTIVQKKKNVLPFGVPSPYEMLYSLALQYFLEMRCDWVVQEVGLGGSYDTTNVIERSEVSVITNIDLDHTKVLGRTRSAIARDKSGIIKPQSDFFTSELDEKIRQIFKKKTTSLGTRFHFVSALPEKINSSLAQKVLRHLHIDEAHINTSIQTTWLPCRYEVVHKRPLIILDGAHNNRKLEYLLGRFSLERYRRLFVIAAFWEDKRALAMARRLLKISSALYLPSMVSLDMPWRKCFSPEKIKKELRVVAGDTPIVTQITPVEAVALAQKQAGSDDCILVTGSFTLCGQVRSQWMSEEECLAKRRWVRAYPSAQPHGRG